MRAAQPHVTLTTAYQSCLGVALVVVLLLLLSVHLGVGPNDGVMHRHKYLSLHRDINEPMRRSGRVFRFLEIGFRFAHPHDFGVNLEYPVMVFEDDAVTTECRDSFGDAVRCNAKNISDLLAFYPANVLRANMDHDDIEHVSFASRKSAHCILIGFREYRCELPWKIPLKPWCYLDIRIQS